MTTSNNRPALTLTDGPLSATIWRNEKEGGAFYAVTFSRRYKRDDGGYATSQSFSGAELLRLAKLAERAYADTRALYDQARALADQPETEGAAA